MPLVRLTRPLGFHRSRGLGSYCPKQDFIRPHQVHGFGRTRVDRFAENGDYFIRLVAEGDNCLNCL